MEKQLYDALKQYWGYSEFRPLQQDVIRSLSAGNDSVVVLPTGGGKSLCYQLPAVTFGRALVVSPLISLMRDQVAALRQLGIEAAFINSSLTSAEAGNVMVQWKTGKLKLLYVAPERLVLSGFGNYLSEAPPAFIAVDEAHCISQWGHDFRPEYRQMRILRDRFPGLPIMALTATASERVRLDIADQLALRDAQYFVGNFDRPNLHYRAELRHNRQAQVEEIVKAHTGKSGIVYCISRRDTESLSDYLCKRKVKAAAYHAGLENARRQAVQEAFSNEELDVVVATVAFGMGIDRSNVRFVVHAGMPGSIENYQQETGRAGRDGLPAECVLLFTYGDKTKWHRIYETDEIPVSAEIAAARKKKVDEMAAFANSQNCRHRYLVEYFGQKWEKQACGNCDNCLDKTPASAHPDSTIIAMKILSCVARLNEQYGSGYVTQVLRGATNNVQPTHCGLSTFGLLRDIPERAIRGWIDECITQEFLARTPGEYPVLQLQPLGWAVMRKQASAVLSSQPAGKPAAKKQERIKQHRERADSGLSDDEMKVFERLRTFRADMARKKRCPAYVILHDATILGIAQLRPTTMDELATVTGIGEAKLSAYGTQILRLVRQAGGLPSDEALLDF